MNSDTTSFEKIIKKFYNRIENDEKFFNYYNVSVAEAKSIAGQRAKNYLAESLDKLSSIGDLDVDFTDYDEEIEVINLKLSAGEIKLIVELMYLTYMKRDETLLHAMEINFAPSDLIVISPTNERTSYRQYISDLTNSIEKNIDNYKNRDRVTGKLKQTIDYSQYSEE